MTDITESLAKKIKELIDRCSVSADSNAQALVELTQALAESIYDRAQEHDTKLKDVESELSKCADILQKQVGDHHAPGLLEVAGLLEAQLDLLNSQLRNEREKSDRLESINTQLRERLDRSYPHDESNDECFLNIAHKALIDYI